MAAKAKNGQIVYSLIWKHKKNYTVLKKNVEDTPFILFLNYLTDCVVALITTDEVNGYARNGWVMTQLQEGNG